MLTAVPQSRHPVFALATFVGTIIGVGMFAIPYVGSRAGFSVLLFYLVLLSVVVAAIGLFYVEVASKVRGMHRLPGYVLKFFGQRGRHFAFVTQLFGLFGSLLAYLIVGGQFLTNLIGGSVYVWTFVFFILGSLLIWRDRGSIGPVELVLSALLVIIVVLLFIAGMGRISTANLTTVNPVYLFLPYGVVMFSLWGNSVIPEMKETVHGDLRKLRRIVIAGVSISLAVYLLFSLLVIGVSGSATSTESIAGLSGRLGQWIITIGYIFGLIAVFTSFIALGLTLKKVFWYDYSVPKFFSWLITCGVPLVLYLIGMQNFIDVISLTGAITLGLEGLLIILMFLKLKKTENHSRIGLLKLLGSAVAFLLIFGICLEVVYFFTKY